jgi:hypothetical protein
VKGLCCTVLLVLGSSTLCAISEQPDAPPPPGPPGAPPPKKGPRPKPGSVLPPFVRAELDLSAEQERKIAELEREVKERLTKILTEDQMQQVEESFRKGPPPPPPPPFGPPRGRGEPPPPPDGPPRNRGERPPPPPDEKGEKRSPEQRRTNPW